MDKTHNAPVLIALGVIALILVLGFFGDDIGRYFECQGMDVGEHVRAVISGYCS